MLVKRISCALIVIIALSMLSACTPDEGGAAVDYKIEFKMDGTEYSLTGGYNDPSGPPEGCIDTGGSNRIAIKATPAGTTDKDNNNVSIYLSGTTVGTYEADGQTSTMWSFLEGGEYYERDSGGISITLSVFEDVGGIIEGSFEGTAGTPPDYSTSYSITDGFFRVKRLENDAFPED